VANAIPRGVSRGNDTNPPASCTGCAVSGIGTRQLQNEPTEIAKRTHRQAVPVVPPPGSARANCKTNPPKLRNEPTGELCRLFRLVDQRLFSRETVTGDPFPSRGK